MKITENMVCELCVDNVEVAGAVPYVVSVHGVPRLKADLSKAFDSEWLLHVGREEVRTWRFDSNPLLKSEYTAEYMGRHTEKDAHRKGALGPGELWNTSKLLKSSVNEVNTGRLIIKSRREGRIEVVNLTSVSGALKGVYTMRQETPLSKLYKVNRTIEHPYSIHHHTWKDGAHYDIRIDQGPQIHEWTIEGDPRNPLENEPTLLKLCRDHTWMNFDGQRKVNGVLTNAELLDRGTVTITNESHQLIEMTFKGENSSFNLSLTRQGDIWTASGTPQ